MNLKNCLFLNIPYRFKDVCIIYPIGVLYVAKFEDEESFLNMFMPYMLSMEVLSDNVVTNYTNLFDVIISNDELLALLACTLSELCNTENIVLNRNTNEIFIDDFKESLNKDNFDELCVIVLEIIQAKKLEKASKNEPKFATEEGRKRWLALQKSRQEYSKKHKENSVCLYDLLNICQFGGSFYVPDSEITKWSYWKLIRTYITIMNLSSYKNSFDVYLQCGDAKLIENHWSQLIKL